jgi:hypothetical protein
MLTYDCLPAHSQNVSGAERATTGPEQASRWFESWQPRAPHLFALIFVVLFLSHASLLRLPYFWDEAGYFIPAARDILLTGDLIPKSTLSNAHPPLLMLWLAAWWKLSAYTPAVTRIAMLLIAAFTLHGVYTLSRRVSKREVALATTILTALYPLFFAQSTLAHLDMLAAGCTMWGLASYIGSRRKQAILWFALAGLAKETAIVAPLAICAWEFIRPLLGDLLPENPQAHRRRGAMMLLSLAPICLWLIYHCLRTGYFLGNPDYLQYNVLGTLSVERVLLAFLGRIWQLFGYLNLFVLTAAAAVSLTRPPIVRADGHQRTRISLPLQGLFFFVIAAYVVLLTFVGGALLARYLLPVYPLVILLCVSTLRRRVRFWPWIVALTAVVFVFALFAQPPYRISPEDNLTYANFVKAHKAAADYLVQHDPNSTVLTAWPASDELTRPWLGYVRQPMSVVRIENFTEEQLQRARVPRSGSNKVTTHDLPSPPSPAQSGALPSPRFFAQFDTALLFSSKYEPPNDWIAALFGYSGWWRNLQERYFDYHRDLTPSSAASILGGKIVFEQNRGAEWAAVVQIDHQSSAQPSNSQSPGPR